MWRFWFRQSLTTQIFVGMLVGIALGFAYPPIREWKWVGDIFIRLIQVVIVPLIFSALALGMASLGDLRSVGRMAAKVVAIFIGTNLLAALFGLVIVAVLRPGAGLDPSVIAKLAPPQPQPTPPFGEIILSFIPVNIFDAAVRQNMVQLVLFSALFGLIMGSFGKSAEPARHLLETIYQIMIKMVGIIMQYAPYGVCALMAWLVATTGTATLKALAAYVVTSIAAVTLYTLIVLSLLVWVLAGVEPWVFYRRSVDFIMVGFTTRSSAASLPVLLQVAEQKLGIRPEIAGFALPLGTVIASDGTRVWQVMAVMFVANVYGLPVSLETQLTVVILTVLMGLGGTAIPSGGLVNLAMILKGVALPVEGIALIAGVDAAIDMFRTAANVIGRTAGTLVVASSEPNMLARDILYDRRQLSPEEITFRGGPQAQS